MVYFSNVKINKAVKNYLIPMCRHFIGPNPKDCVIIGILNGGAVLFSQILLSCGWNANYGFLTYSSYGEKEEQKKVILKNASLPNLKNKRVILVDGIIDSGNTIRASYDFIKSKGASKVIAAVLVDRCRGIFSDFTIFSALKVHYTESFFAVGYGMGNGENGEENRMLPYICDTNDISKISGIKIKSK